MCKKSYISGRALISNIFAFITVGFLIFFICNFKFVKVAGESMYPSLSDGQYVIIYKDTDNIKQGDIIVFKHKNTYSIKRVIAISSDTVSLSENSVYINGVKIDPYSCEMDSEIIYELSEDDYFVIGDNYLVSYDSRDYGLIDKSQVLGKVAIKL